MFGKILRAGKGGHGLKYKIDVQITQLENLPTSIKKCRVVWARSAKLQITDVKDVRGSVASFKQTLTQVTTVYRDKSGKLEAKEYEFKVQVPGKSSSDSTVTIGKATLDMSKYCRDETSTQNAMLPIPFKVGGSTTGYLKMVVTTVFLGDSNDDGLTEVSGMTGLTSDHGSAREQDLEGFVDEDNGKLSKRSKSKRDDGSASAGAASTSGRSALKPDGNRRRKPLPPMAEEDASDLEEEEPEAPPAKSSKKKTHHSRQQPEPELAEEDLNPFAKKVTKPSAKKPPPKVWEDDEDVSPLNSDASDTEPLAPAPKGKSKSNDPEESLDDMKSALFATKKTGNSAAPAASGSAPSTATATPTKSSKASKASAPPPPVEEDEESLRNDLFSSKPKGGAAAAASKSAAGKAAAAAAGGAAVGAAAVEAAAVSSRHKSKHSHSAAPPPPPDDDYDEDYDDYGPSTSAAPAPIAPSKSRHRTADVVEAPTAKASAGLTRSGSAKPDASKGGSAQELEEVRQRVSQLEKQLADERIAKDDLSKKMQKYVDKIADLEDQLAEGDVTELYAQMREMEAKHEVSIREMEAKYQAEIRELMERHLAEITELEERHEAEVEELRAAASSSKRGGDVASAEELKRLQAELREQEALLKSRTAKLEAEQAAAHAARQAAEAKLADANKMIDDSLLVAAQHQQESKELQEEVARLKRQLEDTRMWDTGAAVAAVTAASRNGPRRSDEGDEELEELRERLEEFQEENARLQKLNDVTQQAAADMLRDINSLLRDNPGVSDSLKRNSDTSLLEQLAAGLHWLCDAFALKSTQLRDMEAKLDELSQRATAAGSEGGSGTSAKVKPHELLSRVQQLTLERDALEEKLAACRQTDAELAAAQKLAAQLQLQVDQLAAEKEAVERFKVATIEDLRRQNHELRSSLRTLSPVHMSPRYTLDEDLPAASSQKNPHEARSALASAAAARLTSAAAADGEGNWYEFEALVGQLQADRAEMHRQVEQLKAEKAALSKQVQDLRSSASPAVGVLAESSSASASARHADRQRVEELEQERAQLQAEVVRLQAQLAELSEADTVIKEWSDYADGLVADKTRLEEQVQDLQQQLTVATAAGPLAAERRVADLQRRLDEANERAEVLARRAEELQRTVMGAVSRADEQERLAGNARAAALEAQRMAEELELQAQDAQRRADDAYMRAHDAERRAEDAESRASAADRRAEEAERRAEEAAAARVREPELAATAAVGAAAVATTVGSPRWPQSHPADSNEVMDLRHEISRLEASLSGLRMQLIESHSRTVSVAGDEVASSLRTRHRDLTVDKDGLMQTRRGAPDDEDGSTSVGSDDEVGPSPGRALSERGWHAEVEQLRARNASLEAIIAGLQASISSLQDEKVARTSRKAEQQILDLQQRLAKSLQEKAELESTILLMRSELECAPLVRHASGAEQSSTAIESNQPSSQAAHTVADAPAAAEPARGTSMSQRQEEAQEEELMHLRNERAMLTATVASLRLEVEHLQEEKEEAERSVRRLTDELEELAEALEASNNENERLSLEVITLRDQMDQLEGGEGTASERSRDLRTSGSGQSRSSERSDTREAALGQTSKTSASAVAAEQELKAAWTAARELIWQVNAASGSDDGFDDAPAFGGLSTEKDLAQALQALRVQIVELQKQSRQQRQANRTSSNAAAAYNASSVAAAEVQLAKANARIDELEQLLEDAEIENQHLTEQLEECLTGGRKGPDSVGSVAEECQSSYGGSAAGAATTSNPYSYGHANMLTLSALEQRLAMAEGRRDELSTALEEASATNRRLEADVTALKQQLAAVRRGQDPGAIDDFERPALQVATRSRGSRSASDTEDGYKKRIEELQAANRKLEAVCHDLEEKAQISQERAQQLQADLEDAKERTQGLEATIRRMEDEVGGAGRPGKKLADLEAQAARMAREKAALEEQLAEERQLRQELEETLKDKLDRDGDDEAAETVAAFEVKYNRLKERYKMLEESSQEEIDELQDQLNEALAQVADLQRQIKHLQTQLAQNREAGGARASSANVEELRNLRSENERLVQQLVSKTMELAELSESEITVKRELARLHEVNMKLAQKATTLETQVAMAQAAAAKPAKGGKK